MEQVIDYKNKLFGDVLRDLIYSSGKDTYSFAGMVELNNVMLSNLVNHKKYPGIKTLRKVAKALPEEIQLEFISYFKNPEVREWSIKTLRNRGIAYPYSNSSQYDKEKAYTDMFKETDWDVLSNLKLQGLFKYLSAEEKDLFKHRIIKYIIDRNTAMEEAGEG